MFFKYYGYGVNLYDKGAWGLLVGRRWRCYYLLKAINWKKEVDGDSWMMEIQEPNKVHKIGQSEDEEVWLKDANKIGG